MARVSAELPEKISDSAGSTSMSMQMQQQQQQHVAVAEPPVLVSGRVGREDEKKGQKGKGKKRRNAGKFWERTKRDGSKKYAFLVWPGPRPGFLVRWLTMCGGAVIGGLRARGFRKFFFGGLLLLKRAGFGLIGACCRLLAAAIGPLANVLSIAALVTYWRMDLVVDGATVPELDGDPFEDPNWYVTESIGVGMAVMARCAGVECMC